MLLGVYNLISQIRGYQQEKKTHELCNPTNTVIIVLDIT
jgi:hypothetical protein